jgi:hypothetical protein
VNRFRYGLGRGEMAPRLHISFAMRLGRKKGA